MPNCFSQFWMICRSPSKPNNMKGGAPLGRIRSAFMAASSRTFASYTGIEARNSSSVPRVKFVVTFATRIGRHFVVELGLSTIGPVGGADPADEIFLFCCGHNPSSLRHQAISLID